jgi:hypothetical protein
MLFWSAVINGLAAAPIMAAMMLIVTHRAAMGRFRAHPALIRQRWVATLLMFGAGGRPHLDERVLAQRGGAHPRHTATAAPAYCGRYHVLPH